MDEREGFLKNCENQSPFKTSCSFGQRTPIKLVFYVEKLKVWCADRAVVQERGKIDRERESGGYNLSNRICTSSAIYEGKLELLYTL